MAHRAQPGQDGRGGRLTALTADTLAVGYGGRAVVGDISMVVARGASLAIVGTNGSGKTTLMKTVVGLLAPVAGRLEVVGQRPGSAPTRVAYLGQFHPTGFVLPLRAVDVVMMGRFPRRGLVGRLRTGDRRAVAEAMERMGVADLADASLGELSGGQRQRVHLAQALAWEADLLVLDEPTAGLDPGGRALLANALAAERARGAALVLSTHDMRDAMQADQALLLAQRVVACGPPSEVITRDALLETFGLAMAEGEGGILSLDPGHGHDHGHDLDDDAERGRGAAPGRFKARR